jgi:hypothetical protein
MIEPKFSKPLLMNINNNKKILNMKNNLTFIVPIHEIDEKGLSLFQSLIKSIEKQENYNKDFKFDVAVIYNPTITNIKIDSSVNIKYVPNISGDYCYQNQVNLAVKSIDSEYFTVVEYDDEVSTTYIKNAEKHISSYGSTDIFLPIIIEVDSDDKAVKLTNELVWSQQYVGDNGEIGYLNEDIIKEYSDFKLSGAVINKDRFVEIGGYKKNIDLTFMFEFLLRSLNNGLKIYSIPKIMYKHLVGREGSMFDIYQKTMSMESRRFWFKTAMAEYLFNNDRDIVIENVVENDDKV